jgi:hypothetical protein
MKFVMSLFLACGLVLVAGSEAKANPSYAKDYPKAGPNAGEVVVKGTVNVGAPDKTTGTAQIAATPKNGGMIHTAAFLLPSGSGEIAWGEATISGLTSNQEYWIQVTIMVIRPTGTTYPVSTAPVLVRAP